MRLQYILVVLSCAIGMALGTFIIVPRPLTRENLLSEDVLFAAVIGLVIGVVLFAWHIFALHAQARRYVRDFPRNQVEDFHSTKLTQSLVVPRSETDTFELCREAVSALDGRWSARQDRKTDDLIASSGVSWSTFGERLVFHITPIDDRSSALEVRSSPVVYSTYLDRGRNLANIATICRFIEDKTGDIQMRALVAV